MSGFYRWRFHEYSRKSWCKEVMAKDSGAMGGDFRVEVVPISIGGCGRVNHIHIGMKRLAT